MPEPSALEFEMTWKAEKDTNFQVLIRFQQNRLRQRVGQFAVRYLNLLLLFGMRRNYPRNGKSWSLYLFIRRAIKLIVVIIEAYHFCHFCQISSSILLAVLTTRVGTLIVATIYLQLIQNRYMFRSFTLLQCSHQHCVQPVASDVEVVGYL